MTRTARYRTNEHPGHRPTRHELRAYFLVGQHETAGRSRGDSGW